MIFKTTRSRHIILISSSTRIIQNAITTRIILTRKHGKGIEPDSENTNKLFGLKPSPFHAIT